jgi:hypothetical protein
VNTFGTNGTIPAFPLCVRKQQKPFREGEARRYTERALRIGAGEK